MALFKTKYLIDIYSLARDGANDKIIAKALGVTPSCFCGWKKSRPGVQYAIKKAYRDRKNNDKMDWKTYIRGRLPSHLQALWDEITEFERDTSGYGKIEKLLSKKSRRIRQELLVYAILVTGFSLTKALRKVAIKRVTFYKWIESDPEFVELLNEVNEMKKDFFEEGLLRLVKAGDSPAIIFGNRTLNRDRGYGEILETRSSLNVSVTSIPIGKLNLSPDILRTILDAVKSQDIDTRPSLPVDAIIRDIAPVRDINKGNANILRDRELLLEGDTD